MHVFLTGGSGFVGRHLIRRLRAEGHTVAALARSGAGAKKVTDAGARPVPGDLAELVRPDGSLPAWLDTLHHVDAVVHAAARTGPRGDEAGFRADNQEPTVALHAAAVKAEVPRFVLLSAAHVSTGTQRATVVDEHTDSGTPVTAYLRTKLATEEALRGTASQATTLLILRPPLVWGPGMNLTEMAAVAARGRFLWIDGGRRVIDFIHVDNLADAVLLTLEHGHHGVPYYVTDGAPMPVRDFLTALLATRGVDVSTGRSLPSRVAAPLAVLMESRARLPRRTTTPPLTKWWVAVLGRDRVYDISAARTVLGYRPRIAFDDGLLEMTALTRHCHAEAG
ncbi:NAD(P)-dependent oxidoreductase [Streptomyces sp. B3I8]|uniref:NAD-dependent epimerase/dehydratase family protein n=1 Tax=Streptomyces sp. B3I8 TaxID=3042303 RepID=UPI002783A03F|nr:NAD(P)-dependent oxidoreductase [Streptomyces sp. B3I8]MDQ0791413.1 nucleoside-diphosphate-sugar epimerase [Streptomyces sp. B3I8]